MVYGNVVRIKHSKYFDVRYFFRFVLLLAAFYYFNIFFIAITDYRGRVYSPFLEHYLNYVAWIRNLVLYTSNIIAHFFGLNSYVSFPYRLKISHGPSVEMVYECIGLGILSFWVAFIVAHKGGWRKKSLWCTIGIISICFINSWRVALLLIALQKGWKVNAYIDHHTLFNIVAYILIFILITIYTKQERGAT